MKPASPSQGFDLNCGLLAFLKDQFDADAVGVASLDQDAVGEFKKWVGSRGCDDSARWQQSTQAKLFATAKMLAEQWRASKRFGSLVPKDLQLDVEHFHGRKVTSKPVKVLDDQSLQRVMRAALTECRSVRTEIESAWRELEDEPLCESEERRLLRAARLRYRACHRGVFPTSKWLRVNDQKLWEELLGPGRKTDGPWMRSGAPSCQTGGI